MTIKVLLVRGPLETVEYSHATQKQARRRAEALADLHSVKVESYMGHFIVDASEYYATPEWLEARKQDQIGRAMDRAKSELEDKGDGN